MSLALGSSYETQKSFGTNPIHKVLEIGSVWEVLEASNSEKQGCWTNKDGPTPPRGMPVKA
jgi:hypothetical protein